MSFQLCRTRRHVRTLASCTVQCLPVRRPSACPGAQDRSAGLGHRQAGGALIGARIGTNRHFGGKAPISTHATYAIQFRGESKDGRRLVRLAGACNVHDTPPWQLSESFFNVNDGGECYFDAEYDPLERRLDNFRYHGHA